MLNIKFHAPLAVYKCYNACLMDKMINPKIAIVGRPNVGKSSLFNRIVGSRKAIVEATCGTTRDRLYADITWKDKGFTIVDTGGFEQKKQGDMAALILKQLHAALEEADIIFLVTDVTMGIMPQDTEFAQRLRKTDKSIYLIVNKVDDKSKTNSAMEFFELGLGEAYPVSATNGTGIERLLDDVTKRIEKPASVNKQLLVKVAIVGRPNVGKSSYLNSILREERVIVHSVAGTTRDAVDTDFKYKDRNYLLIDTAGIRHNAKVHEAADFYGSVRSIEAIKRCDVAMVLIDGFDGLREDDQRIIGITQEEGKALVIAVNKWDLAEGIEMSKYSEMLIKSMNVIRNYPVIFMSCKTKQNVTSSLDIIWASFEKSKIILKPEEISGLLASLNDAAEIKKKRLKFRFLRQDSAAPPTFVLGFKGGGAPNENTKRYIENFFRKSRDLAGVPIRISYRNMMK